MKNLFLSAGIIAASAFALASCSQDLTPAAPEQEKPVTYTLNVSAPETKTTVGDDWTVAWASGDAITAVVNSTAATFNYSSGNAFTTTDDLTLGESNNWYLLYPSSNKFVSVNEGYAYSTSSNYYFNIPNKTNTQSAVGSKSHLGGQPLYGVGTSTGTGAATVQMNHLASVIRINVTNSSSAAINVTKVKVANDANALMSGTYWMNFTDGTTESSGETYTHPYSELSVSNGTIAKNGSGDFYVPVHPFSLASGDKVTVTLTFSDNSTATFEKAVSSAVNFTAGHIKTRKITVKDSDIVAGEQFVEFTASDFSGQGVSGGKTDGTSAVSATSGNVTFECNNAYAYADGTKHLRIYKNSVSTISISTGTISKIEITCIGSGDGSNGPSGFKDTTGYSYSGKVGTWTGSSTSVSFTASAQVRVTSIKVYYK